MTEFAIDCLSSTNSEHKVRRWCSELYKFLIGSILTRLLVSNPYIDEMMDHEVDRRFGSGPRELCGAVDLISRFRLQPYHECFCKKALPSSVSDTNYLKSVVGDREIRKGERLISDQLSLTLPHVKKGGSLIHAFDLKVLWEAFEIRQAPSLCLYPGVERANAVGSKYGYKGKRKHNSHKTKRKDNKRSKHHHHHDKRMGSKSKWAG